MTRDTLCLVEPTTTHFSTNLFLEFSSFFLLNPTFSPLFSPELSDVLLFSACLLRALSFFVLKISGFPSFVTSNALSNSFRNKFSLESTQALFLLVAEKSMSCMSSSMGEVYSHHSDTDGFLYITYASQEVFGAPPPAARPPCWAWSRSNELNQQRWQETTKLEGKKSQAATNCISAYLRKLSGLSNTAYLYLFMLLSSLDPYWSGQLTPMICRRQIDCLIVPINQCRCVVIILCCFKEIGMFFVCFMWSLFNNVNICSETSSFNANKPAVTFLLSQFRVKPAPASPLYTNRVNAGNKTSFQHLAPLLPLLLLIASSSLSSLKNVKLSCGLSRHSLKTCQHWKQINPSAFNWLTLCDIYL